MAKKKKKSSNKNRGNNETTSKKVVVTTSEENPKKNLVPTTSKFNKKNSGDNFELLFGKENFILIAVGALLVIIGLFLMSGGAQDPNEWNSDEVYSFRRMVIAPIFILAGLITELVAIFKKKKVAA